MKAMILAAGLGTRLAPLTNHIPKPLFPVMNVPILSYNLHFLKKFGVTDVMMNLHHLGDRISSCFGDGQSMGMNISYSTEEQIMGTGGGLKKAQSFFDDDEAFLLLNGDILFDFDLEKAVVFHKRHEACATMVLTNYAPIHKYGAVELDEDNNIRNIGGRMDDVKEAPRTKGVFTGIHVLEPRVFEYLPPFVNCCINAYGYPKMIANQEIVKGVFLDGFWSDLGTVETYYSANMRFLQARLQFRYFDPLETFTLKPKTDQSELVVLGENIELGDDIRIHPPILVGHNVRVGAKSEIGPNVIIGDGTVIGKNARVVDSIVFPQSKVSNRGKVLGEVIARKSRVNIPPSASNTQILKAAERS